MVVAPATKIMVLVVWNSQDAFYSSSHQIHWSPFVKTTGPVYSMGSLVGTPAVNMTHGFNGGEPYSEGGLLATSTSQISVFPDAPHAIFCPPHLSMWR